MKKGVVHKISWILIFVCILPVRGYADPHADMPVAPSQSERPVAETTPGSGLPNVIQSKRKQVETDLEQLSLLEAQLAKAEVIHDGLWWVSIPMCVGGIFRQTRDMSFAWYAIPATLLCAPLLALKLTSQQKKKLEGTVETRKKALEGLKKELATMEAEAAIPGSTASEAEIQSAIKARRKQLAEQQRGLQELQNNLKKAESNHDKMSWVNVPLTVFGTLLALAVGMQLAKLPKQLMMTKAQVEAEILASTREVVAGLESELASLTQTYGPGHWKVQFKELQLERVSQVKPLKEHHLLTAAKWLSLETVGTVALLGGGRIVLEMTEAQRRELEHKVELAKLRVTESQRVVEELEERLN